MRLSWIIAMVASLGSSAPKGAARAPSRVPPQRRDNGPGATCSARLLVRQTQGATGCFIDERVTGAPGVMTWPCGGGDATATFRNGVFAGTVDASGSVSLRLVTRFHFADGCNWASEQHITGVLSGAQLAFTYDEHPVAGQRGCASPCHAVATVEVIRGR